MALSQHEAIHQGRFFSCFVHASALKAFGSPGFQVRVSLQLGIASHVSG